METVLAVDLAAKYSAACLMRKDFSIRHQFDSWGSDEYLFVSNLAYPWTTWYDSDKPPTVMVVEDLPHGLKYSTLIKAVCRIQGRIAQAMHETTEGETSDMLFVAPATWRAHYPAMKRGTGSEISVPVAAEFGYEPPMDQLIVRGKGNGGLTRAKKVATDYCSAYLIARWAIDTHKKHGTYDVPGTSRYDTNAIRKKEFHAKNS